MVSSIPASSQTFAVIGSQQLADNLSSLGLKMLSPSGDKMTVTAILDKLVQLPDPNAKPPEIGKVAIIIVVAPLDGLLETFVRNLVTVNRARVCIVVPPGVEQTKIEQTVTADGSGTVNDLLGACRLKPVDDGDFPMLGEFTSDDDAGWPEPEPEPESPILPEPPAPEPEGDLMFAEPAPIIGPVAMPEPEPEPRVILLPPVLPEPLILPEPAPAPEPPVLPLPEESPVLPEPPVFTAPEPVLPEPPVLPLPEESPVLPEPPVFTAPEPVLLEPPVLPEPEPEPVLPEPPVFTAPEPVLLEPPVLPEPEPEPVLPEPPVFTAPEPVLLEPPVLPEPEPEPEPAPVNISFTAPAPPLDDAVPPVVERVTPPPAPPLWMDEPEPEPEPKTMPAPPPLWAPEPEPEPVAPPPPLWAPEPYPDPAPAPVEPTPPPVSETGAAQEPPHPLWSGEPEPLNDGQRLAQQIVNNHAGVVTPRDVAAVFDTEDALSVSATSGKVVVVFSGKGGTGKSTTSILLAKIASAANPDAKVVLVDGNRGQGDLRRYLWSNGGSNKP